MTLWLWGQGQVGIGAVAAATALATVLRLTGHTEKARVTAARDAGVTEFLAKPISAKALYQRVASVIADCQ